MMICECNHTKSAHIRGTGQCAYCSCDEFVEEHQRTKYQDAQAMQDIPHHQRELRESDASKHARTKHPFYNSRHPPLGWITDSKGNKTPLGRTHL